MIIRARTEPAYRASPSPEQRAGVPAHPAGELPELDEASLGQVIGGGIVIDYAPVPRLQTHAPVEAALLTFQTAKLP